MRGEAGERLHRWEVDEVRDEELGVEVARLLRVRARVGGQGHGLEGFESSGRGRGRGRGTGSASRARASQALALQPPVFRM